MWADAPAATGVVALIFALVHVFGRALSHLAQPPRSMWLSIAGGISLAYVFVHILPELAEYQEDALEHLGLGPAHSLSDFLYLTALGGLLFFYGLDKWVRRARRNAASRGEDGGEDDGYFWVHLASYTVYSILIGYLLVHRERDGAWGLAIYGFALALHFIVNDQGLRNHHGKDYDRYGRWILATAPPLGWALGLAIEVSPVTIAILFAILAGSITLNVLKEEMPDDRESRFRALAGGAVGFAALLWVAG